MAHLTKKQTAELANILRRLGEAEKYLMDANIAVCRKGGAATTTLHYTRQDGNVLYEVNKQVGSDLCQLREGLRELLNFIHPPIERGYDDTLEETA